jgi:hypothetical protein
MVKYAVLGNQTILKLASSKKNIEALNFLEGNYTVKKLVMKMQKNSLKTHSALLPAHSILYLYSWYSTHVASIVTVV